ncbi:hypothetical protein DTO271D3_4034 [Paecilomyces variotii]|nr:hypothetical protein DTO271D3_4034 [Paecilomyces variotii]
MTDAEAAPSVPAVSGLAETARALKDDNSSTGPRLQSPRLEPSRPEPPRESPRKVDAPGDGVVVSSPKADSEAETIIQSGRESLSPEKKRRFIQHDQKRTHEGHDRIDTMELDAPPSDGNLRKRKRMESDPREGEDDGARRSGTQSRVTSPSRSVVKSERTEEPHGWSDRMDRRHSSHASLTSRTEKDRRARKRSSSEGVGDGDSESDRRVRPQHSAEPARNGDRKSANTVPSTRRISDDRSVSPTYRVHKRGTSGSQLSSADQRKRRAPPPLMTGRQRHSSEDRQSVSSSTSGSPLPSSHLRRLQSVDTAAMSPAKQMAHKKQRDQNGRTRLARACAAQEVEAAKARHLERPEDLNVADNAGNTPLQIAALEGCAPIVEFLLNAGCEVDTKNIDKDTPLIDAVENGHLEVVKLLLAAGANPRVVNAEGDEPYELVPSDSEDYEEIRRVIAEAKANPHRRQRSDEHSANGYKDTSRAVSAASPRDSPPVNGRSPPPMPSLSKRRTVRSEATRNDLLWTKATPENLREFAAKGDMAGVANILNVGQKADAESLIAAAKGGHDEVMQLLLGIGYADPDPDPVQNGYLKPGYNTPMLAAIGRGNLAVIRLLLAQPGFNPARRLFRDRYYFELARERRGDDWQKEYDILKQAYDDYIQARRMRKPDVRSPRRARDMEREKESKRAVRRGSPSPVASQRKAARSPPPSRHQESSAKEIRREKKRDGAGAHRERSPHGGMRTKVTARDGSHSEHSVAPSEADSVRSESQRAKSAVSGRSLADSGPSTHSEETPKRRRLIAGRPPQDREKKKSSMLSEAASGREEASRPRPTDTASETTGDKLSVPSLKRSRSSDASERSRSRGREQHGGDSDELQKKKRRVSEGPQKVNGTAKRHGESPAEPHSRHSDNHAPDAARAKPQAADSTSARSSDSVASVKEEKKKEPHVLEEIPMEVDQRADAEAEAKKTEAEAERRRIKEGAKKAEEERIAEEKRLAAEAEKARIAKEEEDAKDAAEKAARLAREKAEEEERKRKEAEQRRIRQAEDDRQKRLEQERIRVAKLRKEQEEQEQRRRDALPNRLRMAANLVGSNDPRARSHAWLKQFMPVVTAKTRQIDLSCEPDIAEERWVPNFLVAPLLATNDLQLSQYASWEKRNATPTQRMNLWRVTRRILVQADDSDFLNLSFGEIMQKDCETRPKYFDMEHVFWVRLSDFMDLVPHIPHLHGLDIQLLKMHIDSEPTLDTPRTELPQTNGHVYGLSNPENATDAHAPPNGLTNGYGPPRPSTYV